MTDVVFGPALTHGTYACPDCHAGPDRQCYPECDRYNDDPDGPPEEVPGADA